MTTKNLAIRLNDDGPGWIALTMSSFLLNMFIFSEIISFFVSLSKSISLIAFLMWLLTSDLAQPWGASNIDKPTAPSKPRVFFTILRMMAPPLKIAAKKANLIEQVGVGRTSWGAGRTTQNKNSSAPLYPRHEFTKAPMMGGRLTWATRLKVENEMRTRNDAVDGLELPKSGNKV